MKSIVMAAAIAAAVAGLPAFAADAPQQANADAEQVVNVPGLRSLPWRSYRTMLKGLDAFEEYHSLAPLAELRFRVRGTHPGADAASALKLRISAPSGEIALPIAADGSFTLPRSEAAARADAELVMNRKKAEVLMAPLIVTPGTSETRRRLGDLRLECRVQWGIEYDETPFLIRNGLRLIGGPCTSSKVQITRFMPRRMAAAKITYGDRSAPIPLYQGGWTFSAPMHDASWPDDAIITFEPAVSM